MPAAQPSRNEQITALFTTQQNTLLGRVRAKVNADLAVAEDACAFAWQQLITHPHIRVDAPAETLAWLTTVAIHEALHVAQRERREDTLSDTAAQRLPAPDSVEDAVFGRARLRALRRLPERQRRLLLLQAAGYSYDELAQATGSTYRTIDRQLRRAQRASRHDDTPAQLAMFDPARADSENRR